ncbi:MAG: RING finger family 4 domain-containing protein [bacterium]
MTPDQHTPIQSLLLGRRSQLWVHAGDALHSDNVMQAFDVELASMGYALSHALRERIRTVPIEHLAPLREWMLKTLAETKGAGNNHTPLFRKFPDGGPTNTFELWFDRFLVHFFQKRDAPCLHCNATATTHVLDPCCHVVCDRCFDGENYSGCPICGAKVNTSDPFFRMSKARKPPKESVRFEVLHLVEDFEQTVQALFESLLLRPQAMSPSDVEVLQVLIAELGLAVVPWVPQRIPVRENLAHLLAGLYKHDPDHAMEFAKQHFSTATDVLRFIAAISGADPSLNGTPRVKVIDNATARPDERKRAAKLYRADLATYLRIGMPETVFRFEVAKMPRKIRRQLLGFLDAIPAATLHEDMVRHASLWKWVGEFLHPGEYAKRYPTVADEFVVLRNPDIKSRYPTFYQRIEALQAAKDVAGMLALLSQRPGEFARRLDVLLTIAIDNPAPVIEVLDHVSSGFTTPQLLSLRAHFAHRATRSAVRVYFPSGASLTGVTAKDKRGVLSAEVVDRVCAIFEREIIARFAQKPAVGTWVIDEALDSVIVPFNERTASRSAIQLPRGSTLEMPAKRYARLFLHWCEPPTGDGWTDLDLSVAFYDKQWNYVGVCSYYQLQHGGYAKSSGDFTSAPFPDGATEFVDLELDKAADAGVRYAVVVVNAYSGLEFGALERAFAGLMFRDDPTGSHFDPRTVELKFQLAGAHGVFMPLVFDLENRQMHWLDVYSQGNFAFNNVETSKKSIGKICPNFITYFGSGTRASMYDLALFHAACRAAEVIVRGVGGNTKFTRLPKESPAEFKRRISAREGGKKCELEISANSMVTVVRADFEVEPTTQSFAVIPEKWAANLCAADLLA